MTFLPMRESLIATCLLCAALPAGEGTASEANEPPQRRLVVAPTEVTLTSKYDSQAIIAMIVNADGSTEDVTLSATCSVEDDNIVSVREGIAEPLGDGKSNITVTVDDFHRTIPVTVSHAGEAPQLTFRNDVLPVLTRASCNTGRCHGQAAGKDGFRLSLFGYDPAGDYDRITREVAGRRINLATPEDCLLINKALGNVPHSGGARIEEGTRSYRLLIDWLSAGARPDPAENPVPVGIEVFPKTVVFNKTGSDQLLMVLAHYSDGSDRDVTEFAVFFSNNEGAAAVTEDGLVTSAGPGSAFIMARFDEFTAGSSMIVRPDKPFSFPDVPANNYIDELAYKHWKNLHLTPSGLSTDEEFVRRLHIDLLGMLPASDELRKFLEDKSPDKREKLIDQLLERPEFVDMWVMRWAEVLQVRTANGISPKGLEIYNAWLGNRIREGASISEIIAEIIPASGGTFDNPASNYYQTETSPLLLAENVAQAFLGMRIQCAQCHNHPFDRWTMDDYYGFAAFFSQVGYKNAADPRELTVYNTGEGKMTHPVGDRSIAPRFLGGMQPQLTEGVDYRKSLSDWLTSRQNEAFSRNIANVAWAHMFGVGIVEPYDDVRVSNPPSNPALLDALGQKVAGYNFDIKPMIRDICNSRVYQLTSDATPDNEWDQRHFSHSKVRRMRAEILLDCINQVTEANESYPGLPPGSRAVHLMDGQTRNYFLTTFGRSDRETPCSCEVSTAPTLSQALHLLNGEVTSGKIEEGEVVAKLLARNRDAMAVADELYLRCLCRYPTSEERTAIATRLARGKDIPRGLNNLFWALLNSNEFIFNH